MVTEYIILHSSELTDFENVTLFSKHKVNYVANYEIKVCTNLHSHLNINLNRLFNEFYLLDFGLVCKNAAGGSNSK